jgi:hypothetical protein
MEPQAWYSGGGMMKTFAGFFFGFGVMDLCFPVRDWFRQLLFG